MRSILSGLGHYLPETVISNNDLANKMTTSDEWIRERTGIQERRWVRPDSGEGTASMGSKAARMAIEKAGLSPQDIDFIIFATLTPDYLLPGSAVIVQRELKMREVGALDIRVQCSGFIYGLSIADQYIKSGMYRHILVVGSETHSPILDLSDEGRNVSVIFGDGAGAAVVSPCNDPERGILSTHLHAQGENLELLYRNVPEKNYAEAFFDGCPNSYPRTFMQMNGNAVFKHAVNRFSEVIEEALTHNGFRADDLDMLVPHQANLRITQYVQKRFNLPDHKVYSNIERYGNTSAATIPIALSELQAQGRLRPSDLVVLSAFGSGFTWASALIRW